MPATVAADAPSVPPPALPTPAQLAALGTVLCLYRGRAGGELAGWSQAVRAEASAAVDSDGAHECIAFTDADGDGCWKLFLLPDSDFLAWERLAVRLPVRDPAQAAAPGIAERLLQRLAGRVRGVWQASVLRLHALRPAPANARDGGVLAASLASVSPLGAAAARRIARSQGAGSEALSDECCCRRAARAAALSSAFPHDHADYPLVRVPSRELPGPPSFHRERA